MPTGHYQRKTISERLFAKVRITPGCWLWQGGKANYGYGTMSDGSGRLIGAHRASWIVHNGPIPEGLQVLHKCDVPECVNPDHLSLGTQKDNMEDCANKGRIRFGIVKSKGSSHYKTRFVEADIIEIRRLRSVGVPCCVVARKYGVCQSTISQITRRSNWAHVS